MSEFIAPLERLVECFQRLPGIGRKSAVRMAFATLELEDSRAAEFADAILSAKRDIRRCVCCFNLSESELCPICSDGTRDHATICVVEDTRALMSIERVREYHGLYHVLGGVLSPMDGIGPDQLTVKELVARCSDGETQEVIIATNPTVEGETTAMYITKLLKPFGVKVSRLAYGVPVGGDLEFADEVTLYRAIEGRKTL